MSEEGNNAAKEQVQSHKHPERVFNQDKVPQGVAVDQGMGESVSVKPVEAEKVMVDDTHKYTNVIADSYIGPGNAHHRYLIQDKKGKILGTLFFQDGPIKESGINGVMDENLIAIVIDRMKGFQSGKFQCTENAVALSKLQSALVMLKERTKKREAAGKEGTHKV